MTISQNIYLMIKVIFQTLVIFNRDHINIKLFLICLPRPLETLFTQDLELSFRSSITSQERRKPHLFSEHIHNDYHLIFSWQVDLDIFLSMYLT